MLIDGWMYQVFSGRWEGLSDRGMFLNDIADLNWKRMNDLGCSAVYLLGLWDSRGVITVEEEEGVDLIKMKDRIPSMMALRDHTMVHPNLGNENDLKKFVNKLHDLKVKVIVDFVPNHTSTEHPWITQHPEYYYWQDGRLIKEFSGDVAKLNYGNNELRKEMQNVLVKMVEMGIDAVRCDMAHLIPVDFWQETIELVKRENENFIFMAEAYPKSPFDMEAIMLLDQAGFEGIYDSILFNNLENVIVHQQPASYISAHLSEWKKWGKSLPIRYAGNHDDPPLNNRNVNSNRDEMVDKYFECLVALVLFGGGMPLIFNGFFMGFNKRIAHHWREMLDNKYIELENSLPEIVNIMLESYVECKNGEWEWEAREQLIIGRFNRNDKQMTLVLNFGNVDIQISDLEGKGIWHGLTNESLIPSGKAEMLVS